jgi:hypothetical protein
MNYNLFIFTKDMNHKFIHGHGLFCNNNVINKRLFYMIAPMFQISKTNIWPHVHNYTGVCFQTLKWNSQIKTLSSSY